MLTFDDKGGEGGQKTPKTWLRNIWMVPKVNQEFSFSISGLFSFGFEPKHLLWLQTWDSPLVSILVWTQLLLSVILFGFLQDSTVKPQILNFFLCYLLLELGVSKLVFSIPSCSVNQTEFEIPKISISDPKQGNFLVYFNRASICNNLECKLKKLSH